MTTRVSIKYCEYDDQGNMRVFYDKGKFHSRETAQHWSEHRKNLIESYGCTIINLCIAETGYDYVPVRVPQAVIQARTQSS